MFIGTYCESYANLLQDLLDELEASRRSRRRAWENLEEIRWVLKDIGGIELAPPARKTIDLEGRIVKDDVRKAIEDRQIALDALLKAIAEFRKFTDRKTTPKPIRTRTPLDRLFALVITKAVRQM